MTQRFEIAERPARPYLGIRRPTPDGVPKMVDKAFPELFGRLGERGIAPAGPIVVRVWAIGNDDMPSDVEAAVPVAEEIEGDDVIGSGVLPAGRYIKAVHEGPYNHDELPDLLDTRKALIGWAIGEGLQISNETPDGRDLACAADHFLLGPVEDPDFKNWRTEITYLIVE